MNRISLILFSLIVSMSALSQSFMINPNGRKDIQLLNGKWNALVDVYCVGENVQFFKNKLPAKKSDFVEYTFNSTFRLDVPGDFNSQLPELKYYEGNVWYQRTFEVVKKTDKREFIYFAGVNYQSSIYVNGVEVGRHEGGFTPFQFDITQFVREGINDLVVMVNNNRKADRIPALKFDWWNYGGITRDVFLIETPQTYISDYKVQLKKGSFNILSGHIKLDGAMAPQQVVLEIPELKITKTFTTDNQGFCSFEIKSNPVLWNTDAPKLYAVKLTAGNDSVNDEIGFRTIETKGADILLNGKSVFLKGVNFHEENALRMGRATSEADAAMILTQVKALGCNYARTAHYPQNEHIVRMAEKMGIMLWEEIPLWQGIEFTNPVIFNKAETMLKEMIYRDKNRAGIIIWSVANETYPSENRDKVLTDLVTTARGLDNTRLIAAAFDNPDYNKETATFTLNDRVAEAVDVVGINKYMGWYMPFPVSHDKIIWDVAKGKPLIFTEFGGEALYGQQGADDVAHSWSEDYQAELYRKNLVMIKKIPNLRGTTPWVLFDFRSPYRLNMLDQNGWNRKGLISDKGQYKKAWYVMKKFYEDFKK